MRYFLLIVSLASLFMISCGESETASDESGDNNMEEGSFCDSLDSYQPKFTQFITRDDSDEGCPMITPETFASDDDADDDDIQTCVSTVEENPASFCAAGLRCTSTQEDGVTIETQAVLDFEEDKSFTGVLEFEVSGVFCSYAVAGQLEAK